MDQSEECMSSLHIEEGKNTPKVNWDIDSEIMGMSGKSFPENTKKFYNQLTDWLDSQKLTGKKTFEFHFYYLSSSSIIAVYQILKRLETASDNGASIIVNWKYDDGDDDIQRIGLDYEKITSLTIVHKAVDRV
jgi:hypothetical protein